MLNVFWPHLWTGSKLKEWEVPVISRSRGSIMDSIRVHGIIAGVKEMSGK